MKLKITSALLALASMSYGATITVSSVGSNYDGTDDYGVLLSSGTPVVTGSAQVGFFATLTDTQVATLATQEDYTTLFAVGNFTSIFSDDFTGINSAYGANPGFISASIVGYSIAPANLNESLYVLFNSGTELGLFKSNQTLIADPLTPPENTIAISLGAGTALIGAAGPGYSVPYTGIGEGPKTVNSFQLINTVPEPSVALLSALGAIALFRRRRI